MAKITNHNTHNIGVVLNRLMKRHNIMPEELSRQTNIPRVTIKRLLRDKTANPTLNTLLPLSKFFKISINQLIDE